MLSQRLPTHWLQPQWSAPESVLAFVSTRVGGISKSPFQQFNLGLHVGDDPSAVLQNRQLLSDYLPAQLHLQWLEQVHGTEVVDARPDEVTRRGDAVYVDQPGLGGVVMTADCLPVFFASKSGKRVALAHAGWRGLAEGILEKTLERFPDAPADVLVFLGPAIGPCHFEVGEEVRRSFVASAATADLAKSFEEQAFLPSTTPGKYLADLYLLATLKLRALGVEQISGGSLCTYCDSDRFFSYRRDGQTGRFVSLIALLP
jgi:YfiH family protein